MLAKAFGGEGRYDEADKYFDESWALIESVSMAFMVLAATKTLSTH